MNERAAARHWKRAVASLEGAIVLTEIELYNDAASRAYYATMHGAEAALATKDILAESHKGVGRMFGKHLVKPGEVEPERSDQLSGNSDLRISADYDIEHDTSRKEAERACDHAEEFLDEIRTQLTRSGIDEQKLELVPKREGDPVNRNSEQQRVEPEEGTPEKQVATPENPTREAMRAHTDEPLTRGGGPDSQKAESRDRRRREQARNIADALKKATTPKRGGRNVPD